MTHHHTHTLAVTWLLIVFACTSMAFMVIPHTAYGWGGNTGNEHTSCGNNNGSSGGSSGGSSSGNDRDNGGKDNNGNSTNGSTNVSRTCTLTVTPNPVTEGQNVTVSWSNGPATAAIQIDGVAVTGQVSSGRVVSTAGLAPGNHTFRISKSETSGGTQVCTGFGKNRDCTTSPVVTTTYSCSRAVTINASSAPDLTADGITLNAGQLVAGKQATFAGNIRNAGTLDATLPFSDQFSYRYEPSGAWVSVSSHNQPSLAVGGSVNHVASAISLATAGSISVRLCADNGSAIAESNETNNCALTPFTVVNPTGPDVDLTIREVGSGAWADEVTIDAGDQVELRWTSSGADRCTGDAYFSTGGVVSGVEGNVGEPSSGSRVYTVTCYNDSDGTHNLDTAIVNITPPSGDPVVSANPGRVKQGSLTDVTWDTRGNGNCVITGTNGDVFTPTTQTGTITSSAISAETVYTISCDTGNPNSSTVRVVPVFEEI